MQCEQNVWNSKLLCVWKGLLRIRLSFLGTCKTSTPSRVLVSQIRTVHNPLTMRWRLKPKNHSFLKKIINSSMGPGVLTHHTYNNILHFTPETMQIRKGATYPKRGFLSFLNKNQQHLFATPMSHQLGEFLGRWLTSSTRFAHVPEKHVNKPKCIFLIRGR